MLQGGLEHGKHSENPRPPRALFRDIFMSVQHPKRRDHVDFNQDAPDLELHGEPTVRHRRQQSSDADPRHVA